MAERDEGFAAGVLAVVLGVPMAVAFTAALCLIEGFTIYKLWAWFAVPLLHAPSLGIAGAIGLSTLASAFQHPPTRVKKEYSDTSAWWAFIRYPFFLLIGYAVQRWFL